MDQLLIGRKDKADFPDFGLTNIEVKIDSGAYSCSIDCRSVKMIELNDKKQLEVVFLNDDRPEFTGEKFYFSK